jgi:3-phenylpropionate/cinnamic acid dioxygenase small subunit
LSNAELEAREGVRALIAAYAQACDEGRFEDWRATFLPDAVLETAEVVYRGPEIDLLLTARVRTKLREQAENRRTRHHLTTQSVSLRPDGAADAWTYFQLLRNGGIEETGVYRDLIRRDGDGAWRFARRLVTVEHRSASAPAPERPVPQPATDH